MTAQDLAAAWRLDFHHPRGIVPLALRLLDHLVTGSQLAAAELGSGPGFTARLIGTHVYYGAASPGGTIPGPDDGTPSWADDPAALLGYAEEFPQRWSRDADRLDTALRRLERVGRGELESLGRRGIAHYLDQALQVHALAWRVHFATMYRLLAVHGHLLAVLRGLGVDEVTVAGLLQGEDNAVLTGDGRLRDLVALARDLGLTAVFEALAQTDPVALVARLRGDDPAGRRWWQAFTDFLARYGDRGEAGAELATAPWNEDPAPALALIRRQLVEPMPAPRLRPAPDQVAARIRAGLAPAVRDRFDDAVRSARRANFVWWNEEHNLLIDLRAHLPVRRAALAAAAALGLPRADDALYLHVEELGDLLAGRVGPAELAAVTGQRRRYVEQWRERRPQLPVEFGSGPDPGDPVLREILGSGHPVRASGAATLTGLGVSPGVGRGPARVLATPGELADVEHGEVLVCEATSPAWTPVFDRIAACICDQGGMLTHAAIIAREFGVPAVCAVPGASTTIRTGDLVEVDGTAGEVRLLTRP